MSNINIELEEDGCYKRLEEEISPRTNYGEVDLAIAFRGGWHSAKQLGSYNEITFQEDLCKWLQQYRKTK